MAVTIKDIAREAGVSHTTVSRALGGNPAISPETTARIKDLAIKMGYVPSATARGLKTHRTRSLGVIVSHIDDPFWSEVMHGVDDILHPAGYSFFVAATHRDKQREKEIVQVMRQRGVDGVILLAPQFSIEQSDLLLSYGMPIAIVNNEGAGEYKCLIYNDDLYGMHLVTRHLIELGHRKIAFLGNQLGGRTNSERLRGFRQEMQAAGLAVNEDFICHACGSTPEGGYAGAQHLLALRERPTAVVCYNDYMAVGVYQAFYQAGLQIPEDISVTGFDDIAIAGYLTPPLTTLHQDKYNLGVGAARMVLGMLDKQTGGPGGSEAQKICLKGELNVRASTAPPRRQLQ